MKQKIVYLLSAFFLIFVSACGGTWVAYPGPAFCEEAEVKKIKETLAQNKKLDSIDAALLNGTCGNVGKTFAGDVRCSATGAHEIKCK